MATNAHTDTQPKYETLTYRPDLKSTNDLEAATTAISVTSKPAGSQYTSALLIGAPADARIAVNRIATRLSVTMDSLNAGAAHLYCQVYVDDATGLVANNQLFSIDLVATGNALAVQTVLVGVKEVIFNLLKDGATHNFYFFFWVDAGNAVISVVQLWEGVGDSDSSYVNRPMLTLSHTGILQYVLVATSVAANAGELRCFNGVVYNGLGGWEYLAATGLQNNYATQIATCLVVKDGIYFGIRTSVATDMAALRNAIFILRSEI